MIIHLQEQGEVINFYSPEQERDDHGEWANEGGPEPPPKLHSPYSGWAVSKGSRQKLIKAFPPVYKNVMGNHVTLKSGSGGAELTMPPAAQLHVVGHVDDGKGIQALAVSVDGNTKKENGGTYHITHSFGPGRSPVESNNVLAAQGYTPVDPISIETTPKIFPASIEHRGKRND